MRIDYLADHLEMSPLLASWHYQEWEALLPDWSFAQALAELQSHTGRRQVPTTLVAIEDDRPIGSASLLEADLVGWEHLSPWLASLFVAPEFRGRGLGRELVSRVVEEAKALGVSVVYLFTAGQADYYQRLGWQPCQLAEHHGREVLIMQRRTSSIEIASGPVSVSYSPPHATGSS
jgi:predicted N-acetyltransferase YhbS